jgi:hypothetical protein
MRFPHLVSVSTLLLVLGACSTARMEAQWRDPQLTETMLPGSKVLVACDAAEQTVQRICQDQLAAQVRVMGGDPLIVDRMPDGPLAAARAAGVQWLVVSTIRQSTVVVAESRPSFGFGIGGSSGRIGSGVGISLPFPGSSTSTGTPTSNYGSDTAITQVASGKLRWSGKASTYSDEIAAQMQGLIKVTLEAARKDGAL